MNTLHNAVKSFWNDEDGLEMVEYAVIASLIIVVAVASFTTIGNKIVTTLATVTNSL
jgi:Flp pilus assembly pilin Flp